MIRKISGSLDGCTVLQNYINSLQQWAATNKMCFHLDKCKVLSSKMSNQVDVQFKYFLADIGLADIGLEREGLRRSGSSIYEVEQSA